MASKRHIPPEILDAARECVLAVGVRRTTLTDVARRAGVSRMTLYRRVPDVAALLLELMTREFGELIAAAEREVAGLPTARERLVGAAVLVVRRLPRQPLFRRVLDVDPDLLLPYLTEHLGSTQRIAVAHVRRLLEEGLSDGSIRSCDPGVVAYCLVQACAPFVIGARVTATATRPTAVAAELRALLEGWLAPVDVRVPA